MKQLTCEMCGSTEIMKQDSVFVCQTCGTKYSVEEAKKMMVEGTVEVQGTVKVDNTQLINNYLDIAYSAHKGYNTEKSMEYCDKILEIDNVNKDALILKAQLTSKEHMLEEALFCIRKVFNYCELTQDDINKIASVLSSNFFDCEEEEYKTTLKEVKEKYQRDLAFALMKQENIKWINFLECNWKLSSNDIIELNSNIIIAILKERLSEIMCESHYDCSKTNFVEMFKNFNWIYSELYTEQNDYLKRYMAQIKNLKSDFSFHVCEIEALKHALNFYISYEEGRPGNGKEFIDFVEKNIQYIRETDNNYELDDEHKKMLSNIELYWQNNPQKTTQKSGGCYVATCVYGSYDCPEVWTLRRYRDYTLSKNWCGRVFISTYYTVSPILVKWFGNTDWFKNICKPVLDKLVIKLNNKGVKDTKYDDII